MEAVPARCRGRGRTLGSAILTLQYFVLIPPFAWLAKRAEKREVPGWVPIPTRTRRVADESLLR
jgi:hypothetical protein